MPTTRTGDAPRTNTTVRTDNNTTAPATTPQETPPAQSGRWAAGTQGTRRTGKIDAVRVEEQLPPRAMRLTGKMEMGENGAGWKMTMPNGQSVDLVASPKGTALSNSNQGMNPSWAHGFLGDDIPMTVRGTLGSDGKFQVEDFAPGSSDKYVSGRVQMRLNGETVARGDAKAPQATVYINTARGDVEITDKALAEKFRLAGPLGVILPGDPKMVNGKMVYDGAPSQYFGLARPQTTEGTSKPTPQANADGTFTTQHAMAYHGFNDKTVLTDANSAARINHMDRNWLLGDFTLGTGDQAGKLTEFRATYVSGPAGTQAAPMAATDAKLVPDTRSTDPKEAAKAKKELANLLKANPGLATTEQLVANQSHTSPPVDLAAFSLKAGPPKPQ